MLVILCQLCPFCCRDQLICDERKQLLCLALCERIRYDSRNGHGNYDLLIFTHFSSALHTILDLSQKLVHICMHLQFCDK